MKRFLPVLWATALTLAPGVAFAATAQKLDSGNTAWILTSTALVLFMTLPGLSLFYGGLVRAKNVLSVLMQCFTIACAVSIVWLIVGYSLVFEAGNAFIGGLGKAFFAGVGVDSLSGNIPETVFAMFQLTFAIITPALIVGSFAERMRFSALLIFSVVWVVAVYAPVAHWVWGGGWLGAMGALDFAGGTVVHINSGIAALVAAIMIGPRHGFPTTAMLVTHISSAAGALAWMCAEWIKHGKASVLGIATGMVAGLVAITPASGFVGPMGALLLGVIAGLSCYCATNYMKQVLNIDDSLDVFTVHGVGGIIGAILTGVFVAKGFGGGGFAEGVSMGGQVWVQIISVVATLVYSGVVSFLILKIVDAMVGLRADANEESGGLDLTMHNESAYER